MRGWFVLFAFTIGVGGAFALLTALSRTPVVFEYLPTEFFHHWLVGHVVLALVFGLYFFLIFLWHRVFGAQGRKYEVLLALGAVVLVGISAGLGSGKPVQNNYFPTILDPIFFAGAGLFGLTLLLTSLRFGWISFRQMSFRDPIRITLSVGIILSLMVLFSTGWSLQDYSAPLEPAVLLERIYWFPGHIHQFVNASLLMSLWFLLVRLSGSSVPLPVASLSILLLGFPAYFIYLQVIGTDPLSSTAHQMTTLGYQAGIGIPTILVGIYLLVFRSFRRNAYSFILGLSLVLYGGGALTGYLIAGSDLRIPAHYHGVLASILIAIMGLSYYFLKDLRFSDKVSSLIRWQPALYGLGMILFSSALFWAGYFGAPRKVPGTDYISDYQLLAFLGLMGAGSVLSVFGGVIYVLYILKSVILGWRVSRA